MQQRRVFAGIAALVTVAVTACAPPTPTPPGPTKGPGHSWGYNGFGNLGNGTLTDQPSPVDLTMPPGVKLTAVSAGAFHTLAIGDNSVTYAVGRDDVGQLGNDAALDYQVTAVPVAAPPGVHFTAVAAGGYHSLAIGDNGVTYAWGQDSDGQIGDDATLAVQATPVPVATPPGVRFVAVSAGFTHSLAIGDDGVTYAWGYDFYSELGNDATNLNQPTPVAVATPPGVTFTKISAGGHHNLAIGSNGVTYAWGWDGYGQIGDSATFADQDLPIAVATPPGVTFKGVSAGAHHSLAVASDGALYSWGSDEEGQLGDDAALVDRPTPQPVAIAPGVTSASAGGRHSLAIGSDHAVYAWGSDDSGQVGDGGPAVDQPTPVPVTSLTGSTPVQVSAGYYHSLAITG